MIETLLEAPVTTGIQHALDTLTPFAQTPLWTLTPAEGALNLERLARLKAMVCELELRHAHQAAVDDTDAKTGWVRRTQQTPREAAARLKLAKALDEREPLRAAMATGRVSEAQARVVVAALDRLPADLDPEVLTRAEVHMIGLCAEHHPDELRRLGRYLLRVVAPEVAEAEEAKAVEKEYRNGLAKRRLSLRDRGDGTWSISGVIPAETGYRLRKLMAAFGSAGHRAATGRPLTLGPDRAGEAFCELIDRFPIDQTPQSGGMSTRVVVDINLDDLTTKLAEAGVATLDGVVDVPAWVARRYACEAGILPAVLNGKSQVLDLGRTRRLHSEAQRLVIFKRDVTCRAEGCDWPAHMSHVHHPTPWSRRGETSVVNAMTLCPRHHTRAHDPTYEMTTSKHGTVTFARRT